MPSLEICARPHVVAVCFSAVLKAAAFCSPVALGVHPRPPASVCHPYYTKRLNYVGNGITQAGMHILHSQVNSDFYDFSGGNFPHIFSRLCLIMW